MRLDTTVVRFHRDRVLVAVDRSRRRKRAAESRVDVHATHESWSVERQVDVMHSFHCNRRSSFLSRINISSVVFRTLTRSLATADIARNALSVKLASTAAQLQKQVVQQIHSKSQ